MGNHVVHPPDSDDPGPTPVGVRTHRRATAQVRAVPTCFGAWSSAECVGEMPAEFVVRGACSFGYGHAISKSWVVDYSGVFEKQAWSQAGAGDGEVGIEGD